jgi:hypothetical protein
MNTSNLFQVPSNVNCVVTTPTGKVVNTRTTKVSTFEASECRPAPVGRAVFVNAAGFKLDVNVNAVRVAEMALSILHTAIQCLAGVCDGANRLDGQGFSRTHAEVGHEFANKTLKEFSRMSMKQIGFAAWLCIHYHRQLDSVTVETAREVRMVLKREEVEAPKVTETGWTTEEEAEEAEAAVDSARKVGAQADYEGLYQ